MSLKNPDNVKMTESFLRSVKSITKKDPGFLKRVSEEIILNHSSAVDLGDSLFKIRVARSNSGKSGGFRVFYYVAIWNTAFVFEAIDKKEQDSLSAKEINQLRELARSIGQNEE